MIETSLVIETKNSVWNGRDTRSPERQYIANRNRLRDRTLQLAEFLIKAHI